MKAIAVTPGRPETAGVVDLPEPPASDGSLLVRTRLTGICGTDVEIAIDGYGTPPPGEDRLDQAAGPPRSAKMRGTSRSSSK